MFELSIIMHRKQAGERESSTEMSIFWVASSSQPMLDDRGMAPPWIAGQQSVCVLF
jgi:hypothetical protein